MSYIGYIVFGAVLLIVGLIIVIRNASARRRALRQQLFQESGFYEIPPDDDFKQKVARLRHQWNEKNLVRNIYHRSEWGYKIYVFDLVESSSESTKTSEDMVLLVSSEYRTPRFTFLPKAEGDGMIAALANKAISWVTSRFAHQITFPHHPAFDGSRLLFGDDETALRECFTDRRLDRLVALPGIQMDGGDDTILFQQFAFERIKQTDREKLNFIMETARALNEIFKQS